MHPFNFDDAVYVYVLYLNNGHYYTGITNDLCKRLKNHNSGLSKYTQFYRPVHLIYCEIWPNRILAAKHERYIKNKGAKQYLSSKGLYILP